VTTNEIAPPVDLEIEMFTTKPQLLRVLVADDDPVIRHLVSSSVKKAGYTPVEAADGREAYRILNSDSNFKAAIFDMMMPYLEGIDVIRYMRTEKRLIRIPVLMITSERDVAVMTDSLAAGAAFYLPKPFTADQLQTTLRMLFSAVIATP
jgi:CheY-like chemotaxis protein